MASTKTKGDLAELMVAADLRRKGYKVAFPFGEDWDYDLIVEREGSLERVQVKYSESDGAVLAVRCRSHSLTNGKVKRVKHYTAAMIDWLAVYDQSTDRCFYVPAKELGTAGRSIMHLRLAPAINGQRAGINFAERYLDLREPPQSALSGEMEPAGLEPATSSVQARRSPN
jgi:Holliday junction resolvase-like predicted endonuclease